MEREGKEWGNDLRLGLELRGYGPKHVWVGVKYENELTVLVAEADGDDKHRNTGKHRNQDKTSFRAWFDRGERLENRKLDGTSYGVGLVRQRRETRSYRMRKRNGNRLEASSQKKLHVHLVDEKAMDDEILTMVAELKLVHGMVLGFRLDWAQSEKKRKGIYLLRIYSWA